MTRCYSELKTIEGFENRFNYLKLGNVVGDVTFGSNRYLNQKFYSSDEWKKARREVILRDGGCDLGVEGYDIFDKIIVHHMNPISIEDIVNREPWIVDPEYLICVSHLTHEAIHYSDESLLSSQLVERRPGDTCPWL